MYGCCDLGMSRSCLQSGNNVCLRCPDLCPPRLSPDEANENETSGSLNNQLSWKQGRQLLRQWVHALLNLDQKNCLQPRNLLNSLKLTALKSTSSVENWNVQITGMVCFQAYILLNHCWRQFFFPGSCTLQISYVKLMTAFPWVTCTPFFCCFFTVFKLRTEKTETLL